MRYFGYFIAPCILARHNTSNIYGPDLAIFSAAIDNNATYNIGALIARRLSTNNKRGPIYGGIFSSIMVSFVGMPVREDDILMNISRLNLAVMKSHHFVTHDSTLENLQYRLLFAFNLDNPRFVRLLCCLILLLGEDILFLRRCWTSTLQHLSPRRSPRRRRRICSGSLRQAPTGTCHHSGSRPHPRPKA